VRFLFLITFSLFCSLSLLLVFIPLGRDSENIQFVFINFIFTMSFIIVAINNHGFLGYTKLCNHPQPSKTRSGCLTTLWRSPDAILTGRKTKFPFSIFFKIHISMIFFDINMEFLEIFRNIIFPLKKKMEMRIFYSWNTIFL